MKVFNLCCAHEHRYEGWFASEDDFTAQAACSAVACPICGDTQTRRLPTAPHLAVGRQGGAAGPAAGSEATGPGETTTAVTLQSQWLRAVRHVMRSTEDYGEVEERGIRGRASAQDAAALREEGIEVMALPVPEALKGTVQ